MARVIKTTFQLRRGLKNDWETINPLLAYGEPGFEVDTNKLKIGNGLEEWNDLEYLTSGSSTSGADWDANQGEAGYIANRPFYEQQETVTLDTDADWTNGGHATDYLPEAWENINNYHRCIYADSTTTSGVTDTSTLAYILNETPANITLTTTAGSFIFSSNPTLNQYFPDPEAQTCRWYEHLDDTDSPNALLFIADYQGGNTNLYVGCFIDAEFEDTLHIFFPNATYVEQGMFVENVVLEVASISVSYENTIVQKLNSKFLEIPVPNGGTSGQVLAKKSNVNGDLEWITPSGSDEPADFLTFTLNTTSSTVSCNKSFNEISTYVEANKLYNDGFYYTDNSDSSSSNYYAYMPVTLIINGKSYEHLKYHVNIDTEIYSDKHEDSISAACFEPFSIDFVRGGDVETISRFEAGILNITTFAFVVSINNDIAVTQAYYGYGCENMRTFGAI